MRQAAFVESSTPPARSSLQLARVPGRPPGIWAPSVNERVCRCAGSETRWDNLRAELRRAGAAPARRLRLDAIVG